MLISIRAHWVILGLVALTGCDQAANPRSDANVPSPAVVSTLGQLAAPTTSVPSTSDENTRSAGPEGDLPTGPGVELLATFFPVSGAEMASVRYITQAADNALFRFLAECVAEEGFDLDLNSNIPPDLVPRFRLFPAYESLRKYGFNMFPVPGIPAGITLMEAINNALEGTDPLPDGMSEGKARALRDAYKGCGLQTVDRAPVAFHAVWDSFLELHFNWGLIIQGLDTEEKAIREAFAEFHECVAERGWELDMFSGDGSRLLDDRPFFAEVDGRVVGEPDRDAQLALELRAANDYVDCIVPVDNVRGPLRLARRTEYIDEHLAEIIEMEIAFRAALVELGVGA